LLQVDEILTMYRSTAEVFLLRIYYRKSERKPYHLHSTQMQRGAMLTLYRLMTTCEPARSLSWRFSMGRSAGKQISPSPRSRRHAGTSSAGGHRPLHGRPHHGRTRRAYCWRRSTSSAPTSKCHGASWSKRHWGLGRALCWGCIVFVVVVPRILPPSATMDVEW
jgi:hypothetical protein